MVWLLVGTWSDPFTSANHFQQCLSHLFAFFAVVVCPVKLNAMSEAIPSDSKHIDEELDNLIPTNDGNTSGHEASKLKSPMPPNAFQQICIPILALIAFLFATKFC